MALPVNASIQAAHSFGRTVQSARAFLQQQDRSSAEARESKLLTRLKEARELLRWSPAAGRPARFLHARSAQGQRVTARALELAAAQGLPQLRELVVKPYLLLYAHGADRVVLLALKHERELFLQLA